MGLLKADDSIPTGMLPGIVHVLLLLINQRNHRQSIPKPAKELDLPSWHLQQELVKTHSGLGDPFQLRTDCLTDFAGIPLLGLCETEIGLPGVLTAIPVDNGR